MRSITLVFIILTFINCKSQSISIPNSEKPIVLNDSEFNEEMHESQLRSIKASPFLSSISSIPKNLEMQLLFRNKYINIINEIRVEYPKEPLIILESYDFICGNCPADYVTLFNNKIYITLQLENIQNKTLDEIQYTEKRRLTDFKNSMLDDVKIIYKNLNLTTKWNSNPAKYGTAYDCSDGSNSYYSVYFPNGKIESMYMRCWTAKL